MYYLIVLLLFVFHEVNAEECWFDEPLSECSEYCYSAVRPFLSFVPSMQKRLEVCETLKPPYAHERLDQIDSRLAQQFELIKDFIKSSGDCTQNLATTRVKLKDMTNRLTQVVKKLETCETNSKYIVVKPNFEKIGSKYYYIENSEKLTWIAALQRCSKWGSHLVSLENQEEFNNLHKKLQIGKTYWTDINDMDRERTYMSSTTGNLAKFLKWFPGEPNNYRDKRAENCVEIRSRGIDKGMNDCTCDDPIYFICESDTE